MENLFMSISKDKYYPKVLIVGHPFNKLSGGGITISNLFLNWPKDRIAIAVNKQNADNNDFKLCPTVYQLGSLEYKILFPFNYFFGKQKSGLVLESASGFGLSNKQQGRLKATIYHFAKFIFFYFGLNYIFFRFYITPAFVQWIESFQPDIIYTQLAKIELIQLVKELKNKLNKPLVIHIMDDWPNTQAQGPFSKFWQKIIKSRFEEILRITDKLLCISEGMSIEYEKRYHIQSKPFHNPVEIKKWIFQDNRQQNHTFSILYTGRVGLSNSNSLLTICKAIENMVKNGMSIDFNIYSPDFSKVPALNLTKYKGVCLFPPVRHDEMPALLSRHDLLLLPLDFDEYGSNYAKFSMPTKASEYMVSRKPILVFAHAESALLLHAQKYGWALTVDKNEISEIQNGIELLYKDASLREKLGTTAFEYALENYDAKKVRAKFLAELKSCLKGENQEIYVQE
jgi:glycosyltransferase involved in cell wall biosynthesis